MEEFIDAATIFVLLQEIEAADGLVSQLLAEKQESPGEVVYGGAVTHLIENGFLSLDAELSNLVTDLLETRKKLVKASEAFREADRQAKTLDVRLKHVNRRKPKLGILQSKVEKWDTATREVGLKRQREQSVKNIKAWAAKRDALQVRWEQLMVQVEKAAEGTTVKWYAEMPLSLTHHGRFLLDSLAEMKPDNFEGRTLAEVLVVGHLLA